ncbi:MAG TPA: lysylphosphatidylglycerol synthase transmembrane domain-containing protein [Bryobacteraceae bacterium]|nr:lysylphosphatidylglycerol synthase transmembrane domain-containing protein [Bryobacteraceae bacterium]
MDSVDTLSKRRGIPKWVVPVVGYGISAVSLFWVFSKFPFAQLGEHLRTMDWTWVAIAILAEVAVYFVDAWRWMVLLRPAGAPSFGSCVQAVFVGLFANDILPARAGEVIRCFLLSYKTEVPLSLAITSDFIERIMDGLWIVIIYLMITFQIANHTIVNRVMWGFGIGVVAISLLLLWVLFHHQRARHFVNNKGWAARFVHLLEEIHRLGHWRELGAAMAIGGIYWALQIFAMWAIARADAFYFTAGGMAFLLVVRTVGTLIPNAPANVGAYQATIVYALERLFTEPVEAKILAEIMFGFLTLPLVIGGAIAIASAGFNLSDLHRHAHHAHTRRRLKLKPEARPEGD